ncbi:hypothetical protein HYU19_05250 [Candidatus Woesearchaeota archaeon]|nr:hypothetical protein [Candidatus Woesearchaeota archaeon]
MRKGLSEKEMSFISRLELKGKYFFTRDDIKQFFTGSNEMNVYLHHLKKKERIIKLNKTKYFLIPVKAVGGKWSEHPYILIDEIMNGREYCIVGKAAAHYWKWIDQIPVEYEVITPKKHGMVEIFHTRLHFRRRRKIPQGVVKSISGHQFLIASKQESRQWR